MKCTTYITEHVMEVRYEAYGRFLDLRGKIADFVKDKSKFPHWRIGENSISFYDSPVGIKSMGAAIAYNRLGFVAYNPQTYNYFEDHAKSFLNLILKDDPKLLRLPPLQRLGTRVKCFVPLEDGFDAIHRKITSVFLNQNIQKIIGNQIDNQIVFDVKHEAFTLKIIIGPIHETEATKFFKFKDEQFNKAGLFIDVDCYTDNDVTIRDLNKIFHKSVSLVWDRIDGITDALSL